MAKKVVHHFADTGCSNQLIIGDFNSSLNRDQYYMACLQDPHQVSREFLLGLQDESHFIDIIRFLHPYDLSYTWRLHNSQKRSRINNALANQNLISGVIAMKHI